MNNNGHMLGENWCMTLRAICRDTIHSRSGRKGNMQVRSFSSSKGYICGEVPTVGLAGVDACQLRNLGFGLLGVEEWMEAL